MRAVLHQAAVVSGTHISWGACHWQSCCRVHLDSGQLATQTADAGETLCDLTHAVSNRLHQVH